MIGLFFYQRRRASSSDQGDQSLGSSQGNLKYLITINWIINCHNNFIIVQRTGTPVHISSPCAPRNVEYLPLCRSGGTDGPLQRNQLHWLTICVVRTCPCPCERIVLFILPHNLCRHYISIGDKYNTQSCSRLLISGSVVAL